MRWLQQPALAGLLLAGCAVFGSDSSPVDGAEAPGANPDGGSGVVQGTPDTSIRLGTLGEMAYVTQGASTKIAVNVIRGASAISPIDISVTGLPSGVSAAPIVIPAGASSGELLLTAASSGQQGSVMSAVHAASAPSIDVTPLKVFVRGSAGTLDTTFGTAGHVANVFGTSAFASPVDVIRLPDDRIVIVGTCGSAMCAVRLLADGKIDPSFGTGGRTTFAAASSPGAVALASDGSIVVTFGTSETRLLRIRPDGTLDLTFGDDDLGRGTLTIPPRSVAVSGGAGFPATAPDGSIFIAYPDTEQFGQVANVTVAKLKASGSLDTLFGTVGQTAVNFVTPLAGPIGLTVRPNGAIYGLVAARAPTKLPSAGIFGFQLKPDGNLDTGFNLTGKSPRYGGSLMPFPASRYVGIALHPDGRMMSAYARAGDSAVLALGSDAKVDTGFGDSGSVFLGGAAISDVDRAADGRVVVVRNPYLLRLTPAGAPDNSFGGGMVLATYGTKVASFRRTSIQKDGRIIAVGTWHDEATGEGDVLVSRFWQ